MRAYLKKDFINLLGTMTEGIQYMYDNADSKPDFMLDDCSNAAVSIRDNIRELEGEHNQADPMLAGLVEGLSSARREIERPELFKSRCLGLIKQVRAVGECIKKRLPTQLEIAFFPYKASMWDCLESVWREARQDECCSCSVVPIPYYEINGNGVEPRFCYEGGDFPKDVPIIHYSEYDLEKQHPDIIYFHNPYDQHNLVTRVDERYYSVNLKKHTDMLVYISYFVHGAYLDPDTAKRMLLKIGEVNADRVVVQSEYHKQMMISYGMKPEKLIAAGSPKFDALIRAEERYTEVPEEWQAALKDRRVFLWNTTLKSILEDEEWFKKTSALVKALTENPDCALIWRPHPLLEATIHSIRPQFRDEYLKLKNSVLSMPNAILDQSGDANLAIILSGALISDYSSIMLQYCATGKPILTLNGKSSDRKGSICIFDYFSNYFLEDGMTVEAFRDMILRGEDPKKNQRLKAMRQSTLNTDGSCGRFIHKKIKSQLL